jgi:hypothetical protein
MVDRFLLWPLFVPICAGNRVSSQPFELSVWFLIIQPDNVYPTLNRRFDRQLNVGYVA